MSVTQAEVPVSHAEAARRLIESLQAMQSPIEGFVIPPQPLDAQSRLRGHRLFPDAFFVELAVAMESSEPFVGALKASSVQLTPAGVREGFGLPVRRPPAVPAGRADKAGLRLAPQAGGETGAAPAGRFAVVNE